MLLSGRRIVVTGVLNDDSIAFHTARFAQEQGAEIVLTSFGRIMSITQRVAKRLPSPPDVLELDVSVPSHFTALTSALEERWGAVDGVVHAIAFAPPTALGGNFMATPWEDVSTAVSVSAYSLKALAVALAPLMPRGAGIVGLDFDATVAWPGYDWMGVAKAALESCARYLARDLGPAGIRVNLVAAGPVRTVAAKSIPGFERFEEVWDGRAPLGWDVRDPSAVARACVALLSDLFPATTGEIVHVDGGYHAMGAGRPSASVDRPTIEVYDTVASSWTARRRPTLRSVALGFGASVPEGQWRADLGSGSGRYTPFLGTPVLALDASWPMLALAPGGPRAQADVEALPVRRGALAGAWANQVYQHVRRERLPLALARLHDALSVGAPVRLSFGAGADDFPGRLFERWRPDDLVRVMAGAGFTVTSVDGDVIEAARARTLPDIVGPGMRLLICGLNPSVYSADRGVAFARPGNRFWPAALSAGLVARDRDPWDALSSHGVGFTDFVKRATPTAAALSAEEYRAGAERVAWLAAFLRPRAVCVVGLTGWRLVVDRHAQAGPQPAGLAGVPVYLMPNPSGVNAHATVASLAAHLAAAARLADVGAGPGGPTGCRG